MVRLALGACGTRRQRNICNHRFFDMPPAYMDIVRMGLLRGVVAPVTANE